MLPPKQNPEQASTRSAGDALFRDQREVHSTGAVRSTDTNGFDFDLLSPLAIMTAAGVMSEGAAKYSRGNYLKGFPLSNLYNHLMMHLCMFMLGDETEDHLGHAQWNLNALIHFKHTRPDLDDRVDYNLTPERIAAIKEVLRFKGFSPEAKPVVDDYRDL